MDRCIDRLTFIHQAAEATGEFSAANSWASRNGLAWNASPRASTRSSASLAPDMITRSDGDRSRLL
jgi:hypothetical protein